jgi:hypothetical protein
LFLPGRREPFRNFTVISVAIIQNIKDIFKIIVFLNSTDLDLLPLAVVDHQSHH